MAPGARLRLEANAVSIVGVPHSHVTESNFKVVVTRSICEDAQRPPEGEPGQSAAPVASTKGPFTEATIDPLTVSSTIVSAITSFGNVSVATAFQCKDTSTGLPEITVSGVTKNKMM